MVLRIVAVVIGLAGIWWMLSSVVRTVVIPRPERVLLTVAAFGIARRVSRIIAQGFDDPARKNRILGTFGPTVLISLPVIWSLGLMISFAFLYWGFTEMPVAEAIELSGSSLTTLGFTQAPTFATRLLAIAEALLGLAIVALMISFLPTLYGTFSRREVAVGRLITRAGEPPNAIEFLLRLHRIGGLESLGSRWEAWEDWFVELGETHTSFPALVYFRSARPGRSWVSAAEAALDTAAIVLATKMVSSAGQGETMIRSGYLALNSIAEFYGVEPSLGATDAQRSVQCSVERPDFDRVLTVLENQGLSIETSREEAWQAFRGWRINYDEAINELRDLVFAVPSHWDSLAAAPN